MTVSLVLSQPNIVGTSSTKKKINNSQEQEQIVYSSLNYEYTIGIWKGV
jgi:hypothetical protein